MKTEEEVAPKAHFAEIINGVTRTWMMKRMPGASNEDNWQSWQDAILDLSGALPIKRVLEIGAGEGSAFWLEHGCEQLTSLEVDTEWALKTAMKDPRHRMIISWKGEPAAIREFLHNSSTGAFDGGLVDGINENRVMCVNLLLNLGMVRWLLIHDFGEKDKGYNWEWIVVPKGWTIMRYTGSAPHTGIAFQDADAAIVHGALGGKIEDV